jgi:hypothetical protein
MPPTAPVANSRCTTGRGTGSILRLCRHGSHFRQNRSLPAVDNFQQRTSGCRGCTLQSSHSGFRPTPAASRPLQPFATFLLPLESSQARCWLSQTSWYLRAELPAKGFSASKQCRPRSELQMSGSQQPRPLLRRQQRAVLDLAEPTVPVARDESVCRITPALGHDGADLQETPYAPEHAT